MNTATRRIAIVGGGIAGLAAALRLQELAPQHQLSLFEAGARCGGVLRTTSTDGYLVEHAADNFLADPSTPWMADLCARHGLSDQLLETDARYRRALVVKHGRLIPVPMGFRLLLPTRFWPLVTTPLLSPLGRARLLAEPFISRRRSSDESLADFARRRFGREAYEWLIEPLVAGIYTADAERLSITAALPQFAQLEQRYGSLTRAVWAQRRRPTSERASASREPAASRPRAQDSGARYASFLGPRSGMGDLVQRLVQKLPAHTLQLATRVTAVRHIGSSGSWELDLQSAARPDSLAHRTEAFDAVVLTLPAPQLAQLIHPWDEPLARNLAGIAQASSSVVCLGFAESQIQHPLDAFGIVVPRAERRRVLAISFTSRKFPGRAPAGHVLLRVFVGGAHQPELAELPDGPLVDLAYRETAELLGIRGAPQLTLIQRWPQAMPQYHLGHLETIARIEQQLNSWPGLGLASNSFRGVGLPQCVRDAELTAQRILAHLSGTTASNLSPSTASPSQPSPSQLPPSQPPPSTTSPSP